MFNWKEIKNDVKIADGSLMKILSSVRNSGDKKLISNVEEALALMTDIQDIVQDKINLKENLKTKK